MWRAWALYCILLVGGWGIYIRKARTRPICRFRHLRADTSYFTQDCQTARQLVSPLALWQPASLNSRPRNTWILDESHASKVRVLRLPKWPTKPPARVWLTWLVGTYKDRKAPKESRTDHPHARAARSTPIATGSTPSSAVVVTIVVSVDDIPLPNLADVDIRPLVLMAAYLLGLVVTGLSSAQIPNDEDFFNEPSTMRPQLTAAAAKDGISAAADFASPSSSSSPYQVVARGVPGARIHYAAPSA